MELKKGDLKVVVFNKEEIENYIKAGWVLVEKPIIEEIIDEVEEKPIIEETIGEVEEKPIRKSKKNQR